MLKIYDAPRSGHSHRVRLAASLMGLDYESVPVESLEGGRTGEEYLQLNPFGQIPVLIDGDTLVRDSNAILIYLAEKYDTERRWLPEDLALRTQVMSGWRSRRDTSIAARSWPASSRCSTPHSITTWHRKSPHSCFASWMPICVTAPGSSVRNRPSPTSPAILTLRSPTRASCRWSLMRIFDVGLQPLRVSRVSTRCSGPARLRAHERKNTLSCWRAGRSKPQRRAG